MESGFEYFAFISYKHEDKKWAMWLQGKLEGYRLPSVIRKEIPRLPKQIRPVFRDDTDLGPGMLTENLRNELEKSQYLIVICSPLSAQSEWVGKEITAFIEMGRATRIIPFIIDGEPKSNDERECFHSVIKEKIPDVLGININKIGKQQAFVKVAAKLLDLRFDALWNRFLREQRKQRVIAAVAGLLLLVGAGRVWDYNRIKKEYYADYVDKNGIPEGIVKLSKSEIKKRNSHYRFERRHNLLERVVHANSMGTPVKHDHTEHTDRPAIQELKYENNDITLSKTELKNIQGKTIAIYLWSGEKDKIDIKDSESGLGAFLASSFTSMSNLFEQNSNIAEIKRFKLTRENGYIKSKEFKRFNGEDKYPAHDASGIWGFEYELDNSGRVEELYYLGYANEKYFRSPDKEGIMGRKYKYDEYGNISRTEYFDKDKKPVFNEQGWAICENVSDKNGNIIESSYRGIDGNLCLRKDGYAKVTYTYDKRGNRIEEAYFGTGTDGNLVLNNFSFAKVKTEYERGKRTEETYFGTDGNLCLHIDNYAKVKWAYDGSGNMIEQAYFDSEDNPCLHKDGYAKVKWTYDESGNMIEQAYIDLGKNIEQYYLPGSPLLTVKYNERGDWTEQVYSGLRYLPRFNNSIYEKVEAKYESGNIIEMAFFKKEFVDDLFLIKDSFAKVTWTYNGSGNIEEEAYFETENGDNRRLSIDGYARWTAKYDVRGNRIEQAFFGTDDDVNPILIKDEGYARWTAKYDVRGNRIEQAFFRSGDDVDLILLKTGYARWTAKYDERGNIIETVFFGTDDDPILIEDSYARWTAKYDERRNRIEQAFFRSGDNDDLVLLKTGYARWTAKYDERGNIVETTFFGSDNKPILLEGGYAKRTVIYNADGNIIEMAFFGTDDKPILLEGGYTKWTVEYDELERMFKRAYFGLDGNLCMTVDGIRGIKGNKYDKYGNIIIEADRDSILFINWKEMYKYYERENIKAEIIKNFGDFEEDVTRKVEIHDGSEGVTDYRAYLGNNELLGTTSVYFAVEEGGAAWQKGLRGKMIVIKYGDWEFGDTYFELLTKTVPENIEKDKKLVLLNEAGQIVQYDFGKGPMGFKALNEIIPGTLFYKIEKQYNEWKGVK